MITPGYKLYSKQAFTARNTPYETVEQSDVCSLTYTHLLFGLASDVKTVFCSLSLYIYTYSMCYADTHIYVYVINPLYTYRCARECSCASARVPYGVVFLSQSRARAEIQQTL